MTCSSIQYIRCARQKSVSEVATCVYESVQKLRWIPAGLFIYGGQRSCPAGHELFVSFAFAMLHHLLYIAAITFQEYRKKKTRDESEWERVKSFSWIHLCWIMVKDIGSPYLFSFILYRDTFAISSKNQLAIFFLTPAPWSITAAICGFLDLKGFGTQQLVVDSIVSLLGWWHLREPGNWLGVFKGPAFPSADPSRPARMHTVYMGLYMATLPGALFGAALFISLIIIVVIIALSVISNDDKKPRESTGGTKFAGFLLGCWLIFFFIVFITPFLAIWELFWYLPKIGIQKRKQGAETEFPPVRMCREMFKSRGEAGVKWMWVAKKVLYYPWCVLQFVVFVGRWMVLANLLPVAGDAFCPSSIKELAASYALFPLFTLSVPIILAQFGLTP
jgi:hypothetical protein